MRIVQNKHSSAIPLEVGATIGKYELVEKIGAGAMSVVYKAKDVALNRPVAIKFLLLDALDGTEFLSRFKQEARALAALEHHNIVKVHEINATTNGAPYIVMNFLNGITLAELLAREGKLSQERWFTTMLQACAAVEHAHLNKIIHRDLKPSNLVLVEENGSEVVKLIDFGIAKNMLDDKGLTKTGNAFGTPLYMSPEQCAGDKLDERSDIYSLGCIMYEALAGKAPLVGDNSLSTMQKHLKDVPEPLSTLLSDKNDSKIKSLDRVVMKCLKKNPSDRYQKVGHLKKDLNSLLQGKQPSLRLALPGRTQRFISIALMVGIGLCVITLTALQISKRLSIKDLRSKSSVTQTLSPQAPTAGGHATTKSVNEVDTQKSAEPAQIVDPVLYKQKQRVFRQIMDECRAALKEKNSKLAIEKAKECLPLSIQLNKGGIRTAEIYWHIAQAELNLQEYSAAKRDFKLALDAVSNEPDNVGKHWKYQALIGMGRMARANGEYSEALSFFDRAYKTVQATSQDPQDPKSEEKRQKHIAVCMANIGDVYKLLNETEKCKIYWRASLKIRPNNPELAKKLRQLP